MQRDSLVRNAMLRESAIPILVILVPVIDLTSIAISLSFILGGQFPGGHLRTHCGQHHLRVMAIGGSRLWSYAAQSEEGVI